MRLTRREFMKANAIATAAAVAGISVPAGAAKLLSEVEQNRLLWSKAPCRFCGVGCGVMVATREGRVVATHGDVKA